MSYLSEIPHPKPCVKCGKPTRDLRWVEGHTASLCYTCSTKNPVQSTSSEALKKLAETRGIKYELPSIPALEDKPEVCKVFALLIDAEGSVGEVLTGLDKINKEYRYMYNIPYIRFETKTKELIEKIAGYFGVKVSTYIPPPPAKPSYSCYAGYSRAIAILLLTKPYLTKWRERANELIEKYRERPTIRVGTAETNLKTPEEEGSPSQWVLRIWEADMPEWVGRMEALMEKPLREREKQLVSSFIAYLQEHEFLTPRQLEVLSKLAERYDVALPAIRVGSNPKSLNEGEKSMEISVKGKIYRTLEDISVENLSQFIKEHIGDTVKAVALEDEEGGLIVVVQKEWS